MRLVLASNNAKKLVELQSLFAPLGLELAAQGALDIPEAEEPHITFVENALAKARHASQASGSAAIADDSGLCVDALGGAPGVQSARFATLFGGPRDDEANNDMLLLKLEGVHDRRSRFVSALVSVRNATDPEPLIAFGRWDGQVLHERRGEGGFGYDPLMFIPALQKTVAELAPQVKNQYSHRATAARQMLQLMREVWHLG
ncbi:MAG TPA: RdgB/HAM1 family non-canonical purine NTP pyrophosphatase [Burkholderiaceae bacterium]|nr:RdgB/HAM1 family non-canonical purine NTP pyrophosphatase [Burkholderiaceae bacterium]